MIKVSVPGKLIISGEHAVVYGSPALAAAIDKYVHVELASISETQIEFLAGTQFTIKISLPDFWQRFSELQKRYQNFLAGKCAVTAISQDWYDLPLYALGQFLQYTQIDLTQGLRFTIGGDLPVGYGLGSSAAIIVAILRAACEYFKRPLTLPELQRLAVLAENLQHGHSSGLDPSICLQGGVVLYTHDGHFDTRNYKPWPAHLINTGRPQSSTGECVSWVKQHAYPSLLWERFADVTRACDRALQNQNLAELQAAIRENHQLLCRIGVVPQAIQEIIEGLEERGYAAKICGAGSIRGNNVGYLLIVGTNDITHYLEQFGYYIEQVHLGISAS
jgi:mevalonate kinase